MAEGTMERLFVNNNHKGFEFIQLMNGNSWTLIAICNDISAKFKIKNYNADIVVVWIDLEKQACGSPNVAVEIHNALVTAGADPSKICVCVPDRMSENAILADENLIRDEFGDPNYVYDLEGSNGKHKLKEMYAANGEAYKPTKQGVALLKKMRLSNAATASPSIAPFYAKISALTGCWWF